MLTFIDGNIFESNAEVYVNPVNCVGIMGKGLAKVFKDNYPDMFKEYKQMCNDHKLIPGTLHIYETKLPCPKYIINFPTKVQWTVPSTYRLICISLLALRDIIIVNNISSVAIPAIGCGCGGLDWNIVKEHITTFLDNLPNTDIVVYNPF